MMLSAKQKRAFTLAISLFSEKHVSATKIIEDLGCSEATLTRSLRDLRETYNVTIKYSKSTHSYQLTDTGNLTKKDISHMKTAIEKHDASDINDETVSLTKIRKRAVTLSLTNAAISKLDKRAAAEGKTRSDIVESLIKPSFRT
ncbi:helix-turn-helix domain-containing protein [Aeromonas caviae]|uniref:Helix-turn-helix domain-containing protein n=1 Tax=Aeromonas caviae TaxID=648 RepID=A0ABU5W999_AERCA|nr:MULTISPECIES: helix-turn-helix domain-containing protein [Aeromonas]MEA9423383.1 helix-turn-helix domain-containing protein [Aeromonas caviae]MEA9437466.1 helix-turn-helix domain-containing protein [Aeromonas caviae]BDS28558.1 tellurium resistance protein TerW [Aeromonas caviae]